MEKIIFATSNEGKMREIRQILSDLGCELQSMKEAGITVDIVENGSTFEENAIIKAKAVAACTNAIVLADDSGLEVDYMDKQPGVFSARFLGENTPYSVKNQYIIEKLANAKEEERTARFVCVIAAVLPYGELLTARATIEGRIAYQEEGEGGFGYDPILYLPEYGTTTAGLPMEQKNKISHRGKALELIKEKLKQRYGISQAQE